MRGFEMQMSYRWRAILRGFWPGYAVGLTSVALVSALIGLLMERISIPNVSMFYLIAVLVTATVFGSGSAILASVLAFLAFNWFFVEPRYSFTIANPEEWVALLLFLLTAIVTGQLAAGQHRRARQAEQRERESAVLYDVVRLVSDPDLGHALDGVAGRLRQELGLAAVAIELPGNGDFPARAVSGDADALPPAHSVSRTPAELLSEGVSPSPSKRGAPGRWIKVMPPRPPGLRTARPTSGVHLVPVKSQDRPVGVLLLAHSPDAPEFNPAEDRLLSTVAAQLGLAIERRRLRREATEAEVLRNTDELKTALLNAVSHDLRTPLASIMASGGSLLEKDVQWTEQEKDAFAGAIVREAGRLNRIVGNLLDLSRIEAGSLRPELDWYPIESLVDDVLGRLRPATAQHRIVLDIQKELPPVKLDYVQIDQVLSNLIENAAKYSPAGGDIRIAARRDGDVVRIEVADQGPGILAKDVHQLFKQFHRLDSTGPRPKGTGLGLAVARGLVEAHNGKVWVERAPGGGANFVFTLPLIREEDPFVAG